MTHNEMIEVIAAHRDGKTIQFSRDGDTWDDMGEGPGWNFNCFTFRVKPPEPVELEAWFFNGNYQFSTLGMSELNKNVYLRSGYKYKKMREVIE